MHLQGLTLYAPSQRPTDSSVRVHREAPELEHIQQQRFKRNFQDCSECSNYNAEVTSALKSHTKERIIAAKRKRADHIADERCERLCYYERMAKSMSADSAGALCIVCICCHCTLTVDRCAIECVQAAVFRSSWTSGTRRRPHALSSLCSREPGGRQRAMKCSSSTCSACWHICLVARSPLFTHTTRPSRVTPMLTSRGFVVCCCTSAPALFFLHSISCIPLLHNATKHRYDGVPLPATLYIQADNASDNKNWSAFDALCPHV